MGFYTCSPYLGFAYTCPPHLEFCKHLPPSSGAVYTCAPHPGAVYTYLPYLGLSTPGHLTWRPATLVHLSRGLSIPVYLTWELSTSLGLDMQLTRHHPRLCLLQTHSPQGQVDPPWGAEGGRPSQAPTVCLGPGASSVPPGLGCVRNIPDPELASSPGQNWLVEPRQAGPFTVCFYFQPVCPEDMAAKAPI